MAEVRVGCSGWVYAHWNGAFYPEGLRAADRLAFYASRFDCVELNAPFYRTPSESAVDGWRERTPDGFRFAWKASQWITHRKRLTDPAGTLTLTLERAARLSEKLACLLFQLPPSLKRDDERLAAFLAALPKDVRAAVEFRRPDWYAGPVLDALRDHDVALVVSDHKDAPAPWETPASWTYVRGHGPTGGYFGDYLDEALDCWAADLAAGARGGRNAYCFFDNDIGGAAPRDAEKLKAKLGLTSN